MATENKDLWVAALNSLSAEDRKIVAFEGQDKLSVLSDLETLTKTAQDSSVKNRWRLRRPGHGGEDEYVVLRDLFGKIVVWIDRFKEIGDIVVQYDPAHAALPWAGVKGQALKDSGQWLLQDPIYAEWHKESVSSLLWLHGKPGSGKSTLVSIVIEDAFQRFQHGRSPPPVYFYCSRSAAEPERSNPDAVVASILRQLSCAQPGMSLLPSLVDKYKKQGEGFKSSGLPLGQSLELIIQLSEVYGMTTIIVDALDECDLESRQSLLDAFTDVMKESAGLVKIFVSSRDDQDIVCTLREYPSMEISSDRNTADIESFVKTETERLVQKRKLLRNSRAKAEMQTLIIDQVIGGADGM
ncbi:hypothetical protein P7C71_g4908, partial [Lecanoromycetidae sp. Uapishka_2]